MSFLNDLLFWHFAGRQLKSVLGKRRFLDYSANDPRWPPPTSLPISRIDSVSDWKRKTKGKAYVPLVTGKYRKITTTTAAAATTKTTTTMLSKTTPKIRTTTITAKNSTRVGMEFQSRKSKSEVLPSSDASNLKWKASNGSSERTPTLHPPSKLEESGTRFAGSEGVSDGKQGLKRLETSLPDSESGCIISKFSFPNSFLFCQAREIKGERKKRKGEKKVRDGEKKEKEESAMRKNEG